MHHVLGGGLWAREGTEVRQGEGGWPVHLEWRVRGTAEAVGEAQWERGGAQGVGGAEGGQNEGVRALAGTLLEPVGTCIPPYRGTQAGQDQLDCIFQNLRTAQEEHRRRHSHLVCSHGLTLAVQQGIPRRRTLVLGANPQSQQLGNIRQPRAQ